MCSRARKRRWRGLPIASCRSCRCRTCSSAPGVTVEFAVLHDPVFEQVMLVGEGRPFLTLLAVTQERDEKALVARANEGLKAFPRWVRIRRVIATPDAWSIDNGLLTPTLKLKRPLVLARFKERVDAVYAADAASRAQARRASS